MGANLAELFPLFAMPFRFLSIYRRRSTYRPKELNEVITSKCGVWPSLKAIQVRASVKVLPPEPAIAMLNAFQKTSVKHCLKRVFYMHADALIDEVC